MSHPRAPIPIAVCGIGKIARDQHLPMVAANPSFRLAATVTRQNAIDGVPNFTTIAAMKSAIPEVAAVSICTPPRGRLDLVRDAIEHRLDVMLEKPPAATLTEAEALVTAIAASTCVLHVTWHSREAAGVEPARAWLADRVIRNVTVTWKEDVRVWHPGQEWIWEPGIGVFDPGINALSILTRLLPAPLLLDYSELAFPANRAAPIAAELALRDAHGAPIGVSFDFDQRGPQSWDIAVETDAGTLLLSQGGSRLAIDGHAVEGPDTPEYAQLYARFAELIATRRSDTDLAPFRIVADAFLLGERRTVDPFEWDA